MDIASLVGRHYKASIFFDGLFDCYYVTVPLRLVVKKNLLGKRLTASPNMGDKGS